MSAELIDGKKRAEIVYQNCAVQIARFKQSYHAAPHLTVIIAGDDPASQVYVNSKKKRAEKLGMASEVLVLPKDVAPRDLLAHIERLNRDQNVHGILVQLPLPDHLDKNQVIAAIDPQKDVDGLTPTNAGRLVLGLAGLRPCTPQGCVLLAQEACSDLTGLEAVIIGRSPLVGRPLASLLLHENCTITIVHSRTRDLPQLCRRADLLIAAAGRPRLVRGDWIKPGAIVIDVGIHRQTQNGAKRLVGDVAFDEAVEVAAAITPVPGGVGPMTVACLMNNTLRAAFWQKTGKL